MRILVLGAGVIGSVYAGKLIAAGHDVELLARGRRLADLRADGLILADAESGQDTTVPVTAIGALGADSRYDLVLVPVRSEQLAATLPILTGMAHPCDVVFFGNTAGCHDHLTEALGARALFGFPAVGGVRDGPVVRYVLIRQQQTMLGEPTGATTRRVRHLRTVLHDAGFPTTITSRIQGWLIGHAAFVVPIAFALYRVGVDPARLAADPVTLRLMVTATRQAFTALGAGRDVEIPTNLRVLYLWLPAAFAMRYWRRVLAGPKGELWFAAHTRAAPDEMRALATDLHAAVLRTGRAAPELTTLLHCSEPPG